MFYTYRQNNSGGNFVEDARRGISVMVIVEADDAEAADTKAERIGLYWNGCDEGRDCDCCGDRWSPASSPWAGSFDNGTEEPSYAGSSVFVIRDSKYPHFSWASPEGFVHYEDGRVVPFDLRYEGDDETIEGEIVTREIEAGK